MTPTVNRNVTPPTGNMPRNRQTYLLLGAALLIVVAVVFSPSGAAPPAAAGLKPPAVTSPTKSEIEQYGKQLKIEEARLQRAQADADRARTEFQQQVGSPSMTTGVAPAEEVRAAYPPAEPTKSAFEQEKERREYSSLFASNVALSLPASSLPRAPGAQETLAVKKPEAEAPAGGPAPGNVLPKPKTYPVFEGTIVETALTNRLNGSFSGPVNCQVTADVWSRDHQHLLIPKGSRILGEAQRVSQ